MRTLLRKAYKELTWVLSRSFTYVRHLVPSTYVAPVDNVYHCCVQKTASQWIKNVFLDKRIRRYIGLDALSPSNDLSFTKINQQVQVKKPFPKFAFVSPIYTDYYTFASTPKLSDRWRAFFVMRDPRDIVVSWYFSVKDTHAPIGRIPERRAVLKKLSLEEGLIYSIHALKDYGLFDALVSWAENTHLDERILICRYEDLCDNESAFVETILRHIGSNLPREMIKTIVSGYSFERIGGHRRGTESKLHYRKGASGDWHNYFTKRINEEFVKATGDLLIKLGYETNNEW